MIKVKIINNNGSDYMFADADGKVHMSKMWFENFATKPEAGDYMFISESLITDPEERITPKTYGPFTTSGYAKSPENMNEEDFVVIVSNERMLIYHRYYG